MSQRVRTWCCTVYEKEWVQFENACVVEYAGGKLVYYVYGREICPTTGKKHLQGYLEFKNARTMSGVKKVYGNIHLEPRKGSAMEAIQYCKKDGDYECHGTEPSGQGARSDLSAVKQLVDEGKSMYEIVEEVGSSYQAVRHAELLMKYRRCKRSAAPVVRWYYGPTGCGKSYSACMEATQLGVDYWMSTGKLDYWNGYECEKYVILDDFRPSHCDFATLLRWLDIYDVRVNTKYGHRALLAETIVITSSMHPAKLFEYKTDENLNQLLRRITEIKEFNTRWGVDTCTEVGGNTSPDLVLGDEVVLAREVVPDRIYEISEADISTTDIEQRIYEIPTI